MTKLDIFKIHNEQFLEKLFNSEVIISEKINGNAFSFMLKNNELIFFKNNTPIKKIDRLLIQFYEKPINYFLGKIEDIKIKCKENYKYCFEYFINQTPNNIFFNNKEIKNSLFLSHIITDNREIISDLNILEEYSDFLNVSQPPIFFQGYLTDIQKQDLLIYLNGENRTQTTFLNKLFNTLNINISVDEINNNYDAIYFSFKNENEKFLAKIVNDKFNDITIKIDKHDIFPLIYSDILEYININIEKINNFLFLKKDPEDKYIELISSLFNIFFKENHIKYNNIYDELPDFVKKPEFDINRKYIDNLETLNLIDNLDGLHIFKIFIILFRNKRKNVREFLNPNLLTYQNEIVDLIWSKISNEKYDILEINEKTEDDFVKITNMEDSILVMKIVAFWQDLLEKPKEIEQTEETEEIVLYIGNINYFENELENLIKKYENLNIIKIGEFNNIPNDFYEKSFKLLKDKYSIKYDFQNYINIEKYINKKIKTILIEEKLYSELNIQLKYLSYKYKIDIKDIYFIKTNEIILNEFIEKNDYLSFMKLTLPETHLFYPELQKYFKK